MASSSIDNVNILMAQYTLKLENESLNQNLTCTICNKLVVDAYQTYCGCKYCRVCIDAYMADGDKYCSGNKKECKEEYLVFEKNVIRNVLLDWKILKTKVHCPNKSCPCITELSQLKDHLRECSQNLTECPYTFIGCDAERASKDGISIHIRDDTLTHSQLLIELIHNLKNEISGLKEDFGESKLEISTLKEELRMKDVQMECLKGEIENQKRDTDELRKKITSLKIECDKREIMMDGMKKEVATLKKDVTTLKKDVTTLKKEMDGVKREEATLKKEMDGMKREMATLKKEMEEVRECSRNIKNTVETSERESTKYRDETRSTLIKMKEETDKKESAATVTQSMNDVRARFDKLTKIIDKVNVGTNTKVAVSQLSFTVDKFSARKTTEEEILSPYFYSHTNGYKLRLRLYPGGRDGGRGTYLSVYIQICQGEYDDVLPWPCRHTFTLSVINQRDGGTYTSRTFNYATVPNNLRDTFDKPINKDNDPRGYFNFVSHADLQSVVGLTVDDSVIVRCVVGAPP